MSLGELVVELGVIGDIKPIQDAINKAKNLTEQDKKLAAAKAKVASQIDKSIRGFRNIALTISGAIFAVNKLSDALLNNNQQWINLLRQSDITLQSFQKYSNVASILDRTLGAEGAAQSLASLEQQLYKLQLTGEGANGFLLAGINPMGKSPEQILENIRSRISGMSDKQATFLLNQMGIDPRMLGMLRLTRAEFESLNAEIARYQLTEKQREEMQKLGMQLDIARKKVQYFKDRAVMAILPHVVRLTNSFEHFVEVGVKVIKFIRDAFNGMTDLQKGLLGLAEALAVVTAALWAFSKHPIIASLMALYLILEDIMAWLSGGKSAFGYLLGAIDNIVEDQRTPKWLQDFLYLISHADAIKQTFEDVKNKINEVKERTNNIKTGKDPILPGGGMYGGMTPPWMKNTSVYQTNTIYTNQPATTIENELKYAQRTAQ